MIRLPEAASPAGVESAVHVDIPIEAPVPARSPEPAASAADEPEESVLPAARTLHPESVLTDSMLGDAPLSESMLARDDDGAAQAMPADADRSLEEARGILLRAVRSEAPLAGSLTILRL